MKVFGRMLAILAVAVLSVLAVQRLVLKLCIGVGKRYVAVNQPEGD